MPYRRRKAANEYAVFGEKRLDLGIKGAALLAIGIEGELVRLVGLRAENGEGHTARGVVFHAVALEGLKAVLFSEKIHTRFNAFAISLRQGNILHDADVFCILIVDGVLQTVVSDNVDGIMLHLIEDTAHLSCAHHQKAVTRAEAVKHRSLRGREGFLVFIYGGEVAPVRANPFLQRHAALGHAFVIGGGEPAKLIMMPTMISAFYLAAALAENRTLTVVTNNVEILSLLADSPLKVYGSGGMLCPTIAPA